MRKAWAAIALLAPIAALFVSDMLLHGPVAGETDVAIFASGSGDGVYPPIRGLAESGTPVLLVTDFLVLDDGHVPE